MKLRVIRVKWVDSESIDTWAGVESIMNDDDLTVFSVGLELISNEKKIVIALSYDKKNNEICHSITIPRCSILSVKLIGTVEI